MWAHRTRATSRSAGDGVAVAAPQGRNASVRAASAACGAEALVGHIRRLLAAAATGRQALPGNAAAPASTIPVRVLGNR